MPNIMNYTNYAKYYELYQLCQILWIIKVRALLAGSVEYTNYISAEG